MTFTYDDADLSKVIKCINCEDNNFNIYYLDGSKTTYVCSNEDEKEKIKKLMIKQAVERLEKIDVDYLSLRNKVNLILSIDLSLSALFSTIYNGKLNTSAIVSLIFVCLEMNLFLKTNSKQKELKKYKMFLELLDNLDEINLQAEKNELPLDIDTLDEYTYSEVKGWYKYYKKEKQLKKNI